MLCICMGYTREEIENMIIDGNYLTISDFQDETFIGAGCGKCLQEVEKLFTKSKE